MNKKWIAAMAMLMVFVLGAVLCGCQENEPEATGSMTTPAKTPEIRGGASGTCGDKLVWRLDDTGTLTITGEGNMDDYENQDAPWKECCMYIRKVVIEEGVSKIGSCSFVDCSELTEIVFEGNAPEFSDQSFAGVTAKVVYPADDDSWVSDIMQNYGGEISWEENSK